MKTFKILELKRRNNSTVGNPSWAIVAIDENGEQYEGRTKANAKIGYILAYQHEGKNMQLAYHYTKSGNLIFDRII